MNKKIDELFARINKVEEDLEEIGHDFSRFSDLYDGEFFAEQKQLAVYLEDCLISITHDTATNISFQYSDIATLCKFIDFRKRHNWFNDFELEQIIDSEMPSIKLKGDLLSRINDKVDLLEKIANVRKEWNTSFKSVSYRSVKDKFKKR